MKVFKDILTGDELFTDAYKVEDKGDYFQFTVKQVTRKEGAIDESVFGGNASAEDQQEQCDDEKVETGLDFALDARLVQLDREDKKSMAKYFKDYFKELKKSLFPELSEEEQQCCEKVEERNEKIKCFEKCAGNFAKSLLGKCKDLSCYFGENDPAGEKTCCFAEWSEDGMSATVYVLKAGVKEEKF